MSSPILNLDTLQYSEFGKGDRFNAQRAPVSTQIGASKLGCATDAATSIYC